MSRDQKRLLVRNARQVVQVVSDGRTVLPGEEMKHVAVKERKSPDDGVSIVVNELGFIEAIDYDGDIRMKYKDEQFDRIFDATNKCILPGFVDGHTHAVWAGDRVHEFAMKLAGASYMEIHEAGGGINFTVDHVRQATEDDLLEAFKRRAKLMLEAGTTLMECKSGYGLDVDSEMKMLRVLHRAMQDCDVRIDISATFCGAHSVPKGKTSEEATDDVINVQLPRVKRANEEREICVDNIDVFCEQGVFSVEQTARILRAGMDAGLAINFHGEELHCLHSAEMGAELGARAISHLEEVSDEGIAAMATSGTIAVCLPTTAYMLRLRPPPVRKMIGAGLAIALGSDFNPNAHCYAMPIVMHLACVLMHMSMNEALVAATINAAASLGKSEQLGSIEVNKYADFTILDTPRWENIIYQFGNYHSLISHVVKRGRVVYCSGRESIDLPSPL